MAKNKRRQHPREDDEREERIVNEIVVDAYGEQERALGWYYYLADNISFPFSATCDIERETSPLAEEEKVEAVKLADEGSCLHEIFVMIKYGGKKGMLAVPLMQLAPDKDVDDDTQEAVEDWRYWMNMGYDF